MKLRFFSPFHKTIEKVLGWFPMFFVSWSRDGLWTHTDIDDTGWKTVEHNLFALEYIISNQPGDPPALRLIVWRLMIGVAFARRP